MATDKTEGKGTRKRYSAEYKSEALALAERIGVAAAAKQLGRPESQLYGWRSKARLQRDRSEVEQQLTVENARLKRQLADQAEELAILKNRPRAAWRAASVGEQTLVGIDWHWTREERPSAFWWQ